MGWGLINLLLLNWRIYLIKSVLIFSVGCFFYTNLNSFYYFYHLKYYLTETLTFKINFINHYDETIRYLASRINNNDDEITRQRLIETTLILLDDVRRLINALSSNLGIYDIAHIFYIFDTPYPYVNQPITNEINFLKMAEKDLKFLYDALTALSNGTGKSWVYYMHTLIIPAIVYMIGVYCYLA